MDRRSGPGSPGRVSRLLPAAAVLLASALGALPLAAVSSRAAPTFPVLSQFTVPGSSARGMAWDGTHLWLVDNLQDVYQLDAGGKVLSRFHISFAPSGMAWDGSGLWIGDDTNRRQVKLDRSGNVLGTLAVYYGSSSGIAWDGTYFWIGDSSRIHKHTASGTQVLFWTVPGIFGSATGLVWDGTALWIGGMGIGFENDLVRSDTFGQLLQKFDTLDWGVARKSSEFESLAWDGQRLFYSSDKIFTVYVVDAKQLVSPTVCSLGCAATVARSAKVGTQVSFSASTVSPGCTGSPTVRWSYGDSSPAATGSSVSHTFTKAGIYQWTMTAELQGVPACTQGGTVTVTEDVSPVVGSFSVPGSSPLGMAWDGESLWLADNLKNLYRLDPAGKVLGTFPLSFQPSGMAWDGTNLWIGDDTNRRQAKLDRSGNVVGSLPVHYTSRSGIAWDGSAFWIGESSRIHKHNASGTQLLFWTVPELFGSATGLVWDGTALWIGGMGIGFENDLVRSDTEGQLLQMFDTLAWSIPRKSSEFEALAFDGRYLYYSSDAIFSVYKIDTNVLLAPGGCTLACTASAPSNGTAGSPVAFTGTATPSGCSGTPSVAWAFGDAQTATGLSASHTYASAGSYTWTMTASLSGASACTKSGTITVAPAPSCPAPVAPGLTSPPNGGTVAVAAVPLTWQVTNGALAFDVLLDTTNPPARAVASDVATVAPDPSNVPAGTTQSFSVSNLSPAQAYWWKVVAKGSAACSPRPEASSPVFSFVTEGVCTRPEDFALLSPAAGATMSGEVTLDWSDAQGAGSYDVYLGPANPPGLYRSRIEGGSTLKVSSLVSGTTYYWFVIARAGCDATKTRETAVSSFKMSGACAAPGPVAVASPTPGATGVSTRPILEWQAAANAASYDVYLGPTSSPSLWAAYVIGTKIQITGLTPGVVYYWKVVARPGCEGVRPTETPVSNFTVTPDCQAPPAPAFTYVPPVKVGIGQSYPVAWTNVGLGESGGYLVERSGTADFAQVLDAQLVSGTSALFLAAEVRTYFHRVRAIAACDPNVRSPWSDVRSVEADAGRSNAVFSKPPGAVVTALGDRLDDAVGEADPAAASRTFTVQNISGKPIKVFVSQTFIPPSPAFFTVEDPQGNPIYAGIPLKEGETRQLRIRFSSVPPDQPAVYEGVVYLNSPDQEIIPFAFVNLKVSGGAAAAPEFLVNDAPTEYVFFPGWAKGRDDADRPAVTVRLRNPGTTPMELGAEISPEVWLEPRAQWNKAPIPPGGVLDVPLFSRRERALDGSALPRYTYLTVRTKDGKTARLLVQDNDVAEGGKAPRTFLDAGTPSFVVPSVVTSPVFVTRLSLTNAGTEDVTAQLIFTPSSSAQEVDGFDETQIRKVTVIVPRRDVVAMTDPLRQVFGLEGTQFGQLEVRVAPERVGFLSVASAVDAPGVTGGAYGFRLPTLGRGEGARDGEPHVITGITATVAFRTNLILVETSGRDRVLASVTLYDRDGTKVGQKQIYEIPRYGHKQVNRIVEAVGAADLEGVSLELKVESGGGSVTGVLTVVDNKTQDAATYRSQPAVASASQARVLALLGRRPPRGALGTEGAAATSTVMIPAVVNGYATFRDRPDAPYTFKSLLALTSGTLQPARFALAYHEQETGKVVTRSVTVPGRATVEYKNVLEELFGVPPGGRSNGPVFVEADLNGVVTCKVYSDLEEGTLGDSFPVVPLAATYLTGGGAAKRIVQVDGLEQSLDFGRGTRSNLILNEVLGRPAKVAVRLYEAGNRSRPIAEKTFDLGPRSKVQLSTVFRDLGLDEEGVRQKERTNVLCQVEGLEGEGLVVATVTTIDNRTGDTRNGTLAPTGVAEGIGVGR